MVVNTCVCRRSVDNKALILCYPILPRGGAGGGSKRRQFPRGGGFPGGPVTGMDVFLGPHNWVAMHDDLLILRW